MFISKFCSNCGSPLHQTPTQTQHRYCSQKCSYSHRMSIPEIEQHCVDCGGKFHGKPWALCCPPCWAERIDKKQQAEQANAGGDV